MSRLKASLDLLLEGTETLSQQLPDWQEEDNYYKGKHKRPFAPRGVNKEYKELQEMAVAPWLRLVAKAPVQRVRVDGFRRDEKSAPDMAVWTNYWLPNRMQSRQRIVYLDAVKHGRGVISVGRNPQNLKQPRINVESPSNVLVVYDDYDVFTPKWAVKTWENSEKNEYDVKTVVTNAVVYTDSEWARYRKVDFGQWEYRTGGRNPLGRVPFVEFAPELDSLGNPQSMIRPLFPMQRAIDTIRFDLLLAGQFAAYRQRGVTGFDPVLRDDKGQIVWQENPDGSIRTDGNGQPMPLLADLGSPGVDRLLVFPGHDTKIWDLPESNLNNYVITIKMLVQQMAAIAQVPPQYLLGDMANLSGDALDAAESTLGSLSNDIKTSFGTSLSETVLLADIAAGSPNGKELATEAIFGDTISRSFGVVVDGITKLITTGLPQRAAWEMIPGATQTKVNQWVKWADEELEKGNVYAQALGIGASADASTE